MKRTRDEEGAADQSPFAVQFEIINGLTKAHADAAEQQMRVRRAQLRGGDAEHPHGGDYVNVATLFRHEFPTDQRRKVVDVLMGSADGPMCVPQPMFVATVQLVANNSSTLILSSPQPEAKESSGSSLASLSTPTTVEVRRACGERVFPGDVVLVRPAARPSVQDAEDTPPERASSSLPPSSPGGVAAHVELIGIDAELLADGETWRDAAVSNVVTVLRWVSSLLLQPPGLAQLSFIQNSSLGGGRGSGLDGDDAGWLRSLQLPRLLQVSKTLMEVLDADVRAKVRRTILSVVRTYIHVFARCASQMPLPVIFHTVFGEFIRSPLFIEGCSALLVQATGTLAPSAWREAGAALGDAMELCLRHVCFSPCSHPHRPSLGARAKAAQEDEESLACFEVVLARLSTTWLRFNEQRRRLAGSPEPHMPFPAAQADVMQLLEDVAQTGVFQRVTRWLQARERESNVLNSGVDAVLEAVHEPPTLTAVRELIGLGTDAVAEQMTVMTRCYTPHLTKDALRFLEAAMKAAYAELYGAAARAVHRLLHHPKSSEAPNLADVMADVGVRGVRVQSLRQQAIPADGGLSQYALGEIRHRAEFGLPVELHLNHHEEHGATSLAALRHAVDATAATPATAGVNRCGSYFVFVLVRLQGRLFVFPAILTSVGEASAVAHLLRDADILPELLETSAAADDGVPDAWITFFPESDPSQRKHQTALAALEVEDRPRFLPSRHSPAITYMDLLRRFDSIRGELKGDLIMSSSSATHAPTGDGAPRDTVDVRSRAASLWLEYFASGSLPCQSNYAAMSASANAVLTGTGSGKQVLQDVINDVRGVATFTPAQEEVLHTLCSGSIAVKSTSGSRGHTSVLGGLKVLEGTVGSGKTAMLYASGLAKGRLQTSARREQQTTLHPVIKESMNSARRLAEQVSRATNLEGLYGEINTSSHSSDAASGLHHPHVLRDLPEELADAASEQAFAYARLNEGLHYCATPLLLRAGVPHSAVPAAINRLLFTPPDDAEALQPSFPISHITTVADLMEQCQARTVHAPLSAVLARSFNQLRRVGDLCAAVLRGADERPLHATLLPFIMSAREVAETSAAAAADAAAGGTSVSWIEYLSSTLWKSLPLHLQGDSETPMHWPPLGTQEDDFEAVGMPARTHLPVLNPDQSAGWFTVYAENQASVAHHLLCFVHEMAQQLFRQFYDAVTGVAAVSQSTRPLLITTTGAELLLQQHLPFLWAWCPQHLLVDDFECVQNELLLTLTPANNTTVAVSTETPAPLEHHQQGAMAVLRALRKDLQRTAALTTATLREPQRCQRGSLNTALTQLCLGSDEGDLDASGPFSETAVTPADRDDTLDEEGAVSGDDGSLGAPRELLDEGLDSEPSPSFPGFVSRSAVEAWTHATPLSLSSSADQVAAAFLARCFHGYEPHLVIHIYTAFVEDHAAVQRGVMESIENSAEPSKPPVEVRYIPLNVGSGVPVNADDECDIALLLLSGFSQRLEPTTMQQSSAASLTRRVELWGRLLQQSGRVLTQQLQVWLWRAISRARRGAVLVGSKELFLQVPLLRRLEGFVAQQRSSLATQPHLQFWLPPAAECAVLALSCPDHHKCKRIALISTSDGESGEAQVTVEEYGTRECQFLCLKPFDNCERALHACVHPCHLLRDAEGGSTRSDLHAHCPFPCCLTLPCGHICDRPCGESCAPCTFTGLRELSCGQRVVRGMGADKTVLYHTFHHFQEARCGEGVSRCVVPVAVRCPRCAFKTLLPCAEVTHRQQLLKDKSAAEDGDVSSNLAAREPYALPEGDCTGCVQVFNKVAAKHGIVPLAVPSAERGVAEATEDDPASADASLPRHLLSAEALADLQREQAIAQKKAELLLIKEALEMTSGKATEKADYVRYKAIEDAQRALQEKQQAERQQRVRQDVEKWVQRLREDVEQQSTLSAEMEAVIPYTRSKAEEEAERQREYTF